MATVEQQPPSPFTPPTSPLSPVPPSPTAARSPSPSSSVFDAFPLVSDDPPVRALSAAQYYLIHEAYYSTPLPNDLLFPWLHGVDGRSTQQNQFFGITEIRVPPHRGVTVVSAEGTGQKCQLIGAVLPDDILNSNTGNVRETRGFLDVYCGEGINLRNFKWQVAKYATVSDIIVYGEHGLDENVLEIAKQASRAQSYLRETRPNGIEYETFVIIEPFSYFEKEFPDLVSIDSQGFIRNKINFLEQEREEMRLLTAALEISTNVWLGNSQDVPVLKECDPADSTTSLLDDNPYQFSICIEAHDVADMPTSSDLSIASSTLLRTSIPPAAPTEICNLDCISTFANGNIDSAGEQLITLCEFIDKQANEYGRRVLIHCADGYTETSILALTYLMYKEHLRLPEAYLKLQETRSFFVYHNDVHALMQIENLVWEHKLSRNEEQEKKEDIYAKHSWFRSSYFEGSFPSRILPFLYLGNLYHACNGGMLKALGITHILSVGEDARLDPTEFKVNLLDNLFDDGIDSLWKHLDGCVNFIGK
ncbi:496_t:CDS:2 [Paraglomus occultum]|uniref:496_t:CDS:1 n=1 Tax=Paraglomus occultum TaxID=144539 RepID=A0A9N9FX95_9GLOM|nr:496_t:CDS:2 [Paraglomus occultum]